MQRVNLNRARRIAFYLTQRHRRGTAEFQYRLRLEWDIIRELLRGEGAARPSQPGTTFEPHGRS
jgi:hypothetical protein